MSTDLTTQYTIPNYRRFEVTPVRGRGVYLWDDQDKQYIDFAGGVAVTPLGHCHPEVVQAIKDQAEKLIHVSNWYQIPQQGELARILVEKIIQIPGKCFFGNSGAEANEGLIKLARRFGTLKPKADGSPRYEILTFTGSFHGRTFATMSATAQEKIHGGFGPLVPGFKYLPFNDVAALEQAVTENTVAILFEPVQGESGIHAATPEFIRAAAKLRDEHDLVLLFDEIQCGLGRTGQTAGWRAIIPGDEIQPDGVSFAKSIGSGYALGAFWCRDRSIGDEANTSLADILGPGSHGSTYGGSPLACATALKTLEVILRDDLPKHASTIASHIVKETQSWNHPALVAVRALGCLIGLELNAKLVEDHVDFKGSGKMVSIWFAERCLANGLLVVPAGPNVVRLLPPLNTALTEADDALTLLKASLDELV